MSAENAATAVTGAALVAGIFYPEALMGAVAGTFFFLMMPNEFGKLINAGYAFLSGFFGYAVGSAVVPDYRLLAAFVGAALGVILLLGVAKAIKYDKWEVVISKILEIIRGLK